MPGEAIGMGMAGGIACGAAGAIPIASPVGGIPGREPIRAAIWER